MALTSNIAWPNTLPLPEADGWRETPYRDVTEFKPEAGPRIVRLRSGRIGSEYRVSLILSTAEYNTLLTFYNETLAGGTKSFNWYHPFTNVRKTVRFAKRLTFQSAGPLAMGARFTLEEISSA